MSINYLMNTLSRVGVVDQELVGQYYEEKRAPRPLLLVLLLTAAPQASEGLRA
jgi:hypothetical protein